MPLRFLFYGTVFHFDADGRLRTAQIPWEAEADFTLPAHRWHELRERYFGDQTWVQLDNGTFDRLQAYRTHQVYPSWDSTIDSLLADVY